ncbi:ribonucleoprotein PTB-binding 1-like isoform X1 [Huso huso]|uniref:Ribonucleoprotein PTB-binding 1-like isoform X1 n=1 Tax=Huso huso TaxID=61971 RepID=A0ABR0Y919_HUSHU
MMEAAVSVSAATGKETVRTEPNFGAEPHHDLAAEQGEYGYWAHGESADPGDPGEEEAAAGLESRRRLDEELSPLSPEEIENRLERTQREFCNRRKIIIKNLPADVTNQEVHDLLSNYDLKYCFVDKYKGTAFVTLLNGEQAKSAIKEFHQYPLRDREVSVQLQPTDALLCIANLPLSCTQQHFEELVRPFGNLERCFLVHSELTGHSKGYGFVEYMKKDSAARAKSELLGKQLGTRTLYVHWTEVNSLTYPLLHSRCLCVDRLPRGLKDVEDLKEVFAEFHVPIFCQLAQGQDAQFRRFAVLEFETPEITEMVQKSTDGLAFGRSHIRVSFCAPGPPGRSMLAALIAAQTMALNRGKGLLPEPNLMQILSSLNNPTTLKLLMNPLLQAPPGRKHGNKHGILGAAPTVPFLGNPALSGALLQLLLQNQNQLQQNVLLGNPLLLQSLVWTRLLQNKENQVVLSHTGIMGDSPHAVLPQQNVLQQGLAMLGDLAAAGLSPDVPSGPMKSPNTFYGLRGVPTDRESPTAMGEHHHPQANQPLALQGMGSPLLGSILGGMQQQSQSLSGDSGSALSGVSILGEPPKDLKIPQNPFLNIQSVFPSVGMQAVNSRPHPYRKKPGILGSMSNPRIAQNSHSDFAVPSSSRYQDNYAFGEYKQDSLSHVYQHHEPADPTSMRGYGHHRQKGPYRSSYSEHNQFGPSPVPPPPPFNPGSPSSYFNSGFKAGLQQSHLNKAVGMPPVSHGGGMYGYGLNVSPPGHILKTPIGGQKRVFSRLIPSPEPSPEGGYVGQHSQGLGGHYADSYLKRKRIF